MLPRLLLLVCLLAWRPAATCAHPCTHSALCAHLHARGPPAMSSSLLRSRSTFLSTVQNTRSTYAVPAINTVPLSGRLAPPLPSCPRPPSAVKVLLRHGASLEVVIAPPRVENSPIRCAAGSNALHIAALIGNISMAKLVLEAQEVWVCGLEGACAVGHRCCSWRARAALHQGQGVVRWDQAQPAYPLPRLTTRTCSSGSCHLHRHRSSLPHTHTCALHLMHKCAHAIALAMRTWTPSLPSCGAPLIKYAQRGSLSILWA